MKKMRVLLGLALVAHCALAVTYFKDEFTSLDGWVQSDVKKADGQAGKIELSTGPWFNDAEKDKGLKAVEDAKFYFTSKKFDSFSNAGKTLVVQYQVRFPQDMDCGGGYIKLLPSGVDQENFEGSSGYGIMFGPDICGYSTKRVHAIFNFKGEKWDEDKNLLINKEVRCEDDVFSHVYTFVINPDGTYKISIDGEEKQTGNMKDDWDFEVAKRIKDPNVSKPEDWVDDAKMDDPAAAKPDDWDVAEQIADPDAEKPDDWDDEDDGEWEAPLIRNPDYKGTWYATKIDNPDYKGVWEHPEIDNPDWVDEKNVGVYTDIGAVGIEVWQVKAGTIWDNIIITDNEAEAEAFRKATCDNCMEGEKAMKEEEDKKKAEEEATRAAEEAAAAAAAAEDQDDGEIDDDEKDEDEAADLDELGDTHDEL